MNGAILAEVTHPHDPRVTVRFVEAPRKDATAALCLDCGQHFDGLNSPWPLRNSIWLHEHGTGHRHIRYGHALGLLEWWLASLEALKTTPPEDAAAQASPIP